MTFYSAAVAVILVILAATRPAPLHAMANYVNVPPAVSVYYRPLPVWYFLNLYQVLKAAHGSFEDRLMVLGLPMVVAAVLVLLPFIDKNPSHRAKDRPIALTLASVFAIGVLYTTYAGWKSEQSAPVLTRAILHPSYSKNLLPIFTSDCAPCHTAAPYLANFDVTSYIGVMRGGQYGKAVVMGHPTRSLIIHLLEKKSARLPGVQMPLGGPPLTKAQVGTIANWIKDGAKNN